MWSLKAVPFEGSQGFLEKGLLPGPRQQTCKMNLRYLIIPETLREEEIDLERSNSVPHRREDPRKSQSA